MSLQTETPDRDAPTTGRAGPRAWIAVGVMALLYFAISADISVLYLALPAIVADLAPTGAGSLWILHIGEFVGASLVITLGLLTMKLGRRRMLLFGAAAFGVASLVAAFSTNPEMLIVARALIGLSAAAVTPAVLSLLRVLFTDSRQFATAFALLLSTFVAGGAAGPTLGGFVLEHFWWGAVFLVNATPAAVLLASAPWLIRRDQRDPTVRIDLISVALSVTMVMTLVYSLQTVADGGWATVPVLIGLAGITLVVTFLRRQRRIDHPLLDLALFATREFRIAIVVLVGTFLWANATLMFIAQYLQIVLALSPLQAGLVMGAPAAAAMLGTLATPRLQQLASHATVLTVTLVLVAAGAVATLAALTGEAGLPVLVAALCFLATLQGPLMTLTSQMIVVSVPEERTGSASAVQDLAAGTSLATGIALLGSLGYALYRVVLDATSIPGLTPADRAEAAQSPSAGADVAARLDGATGQTLTDTVGSALTTATGSAYLAGVVLCVALAGFVALQARR